MNNIFSWNPSNPLLKQLEDYRHDLNKTLPTSERDKDPTQNLTAFFQNFVRTIEVEHPLLRKVFVRWLGKKDLVDSNGELEPTLIANYLAPIWKKDPDECQANLHLLFNYMTQITKSFIKKKFSLAVNPSLEKIDIQFLDQKFYKSYHKILSTVQFICSLEKIEDESIKIIITELNVWCLHYLVESAKTPLINFDQDKYNYPFSEYIDDNAPHYHREDGGAIVKIFLRVIKQRHDWLKDIKISLIKNDEFEKLIINCCQILKGRYLPAESNNLKNILEEINNKPEENDFTFVDYSEAFKFYEHNSSILPTKNIKEILHRVSKDNHLIVGVVLKIDSQALYFFHGNNKKNLKKFLNTFKSLQGAHGAYPDIVLLKELLIRTGYRITSLLDHYPLPQRKAYETYLEIPPLEEREITLKEVINTHQELFKYVETLSESVENSTLTSHYLQFLYKLLAVTKPVIRVENPLIYKAAFNCLSKIRKHLSQLSYGNFQACQNKFILVFEHFQQLQILYKREEIETIPEVLNSQPTPEGVISNGYTFTSGIACFGNITEGLLQMFAEGPSQPDGEPCKPSVIFDTNSYYEISESTGGLKDCLKERFSCQTAQLSNFETIPNLENYDVIFTDIYPNRVVRLVIEEIKVKEIIKKILEKRASSSAAHNDKRPLAMVLDCATTFFMHEEVRSLVEEFATPINEGKLILILTNSLAKYGQLGLDKFPGGIVQVYSSDTSADDLLRGLLTSSANDNFSKEAFWFFHLMLKHCSENIINYLEKIRKNTDFVYKELQKQGLVIEKKQDSTNQGSIQKNNTKKPLIQIGYRDEKVPMIGIHMKGFQKELFGKEDEQLLHILVVIMQYYLYARYINENLPVTMSQSFGFANANLIECWSALRLTIGLEEEKDLRSYAAIIGQIKEELDCLVEDGLKEKIKDNIITLSKQQDLKKLFYHYHSNFVNKVQDGLSSFISYLCTLKEC
ncbi:MULTISPECIES: hypothetical protein [unclassified Neochlamydia]|uniref:hypothetical protein n=1 Tax=unclassified Neochlamydia TaxID=2643326 RepID=UPI001407854C|nr:MULTISPECIES: hypothetical protein [unclassified Neochlamydia]MBS4166336.1 Uncharacterized protein [Neochlamydia sp. AcF65]MBS4171048.1 Uncharacterized protein [Neochlamydia sp. AcF95]NGY94265.1 hypothetical protein [Neochlamydia sp. AcF84]